ncbi:MAG: hypothetical protein QOG52_1809 [Frankiaceae bacterium]|nr:hypothetical protein [Frankiaceae bacterium]
MTISSLFGARGPEEHAPRRLWHVTLTIGGDAEDAENVREALERLHNERPFFVASRYAGDRAELRYWEEAESCEDACALALRLWGEHRSTAQLPAWGVVGLEVVERSVRDERGEAPILDARISPFV